VKSSLIKNALLSSRTVTLRHSDRGPSRLADLGCFLALRQREERRALIAAGIVGSAQLPCRTTLVPGSHNALPSLRRLLMRLFLSSRICYWQRRFESHDDRARR